jgi:hypothetical protein
MNSMKTFWMTALLCLMACAGCGGDGGEPVCTPEEKKCDGTDLVKCNSSGTEWTFYKECDKYCSGGECTADAPLDAYADSLTDSGSTGPDATVNELPDAVTDTATEVKSDEFSPDICQPDCAEKECGDNGCGGSCGECPDTAPNCSEGKCQADCTTNCEGKQCGADGCGGVCGTCDGGKSCSDGDCICVPKEYLDCCQDSVCWYDSCGNEGAKIADCSNGCSEGSCNNCEPDCEDKKCGNDGCGGSCGDCMELESCTVEGDCVCEFVVCEDTCCKFGSVCFDSECCGADCGGKECGDDGCGAFCGSCDDGEYCNSGECSPSCNSDEDCEAPGVFQCAGNGTGYVECLEIVPGCLKWGDTISCAPGFICKVDECVEDCEPSCDGKECGDDGCGGSCGGCGACGTECANGNCEFTACIDAECGNDGCGGECGQCQEGLACSEGLCIVAGCQNQALEISGVLNTSVTPVSFDSVSASIKHKRDVDEWEDGCISEVEFVLKQGVGCSLEVVGSEVIGVDSLLEITQVSFMATSLCPGFPDNAEGSYINIGGLSQAGFELGIVEVPGDDVAESCFNATFKVLLSGGLVHEDTGMELVIEPTAIEVGGDFLSMGSYDLSCPCIASCVGKECGTDGCDGTCGLCPGIQDECVGGSCICQPDCAENECGSDGCGGNCGTCVGPQDLCDQGQCICQPLCGVMECGADGCGGECGECAVGDKCDNGVCKGPFHLWSMEFGGMSTDYSRSVAIDAVGSIFVAGATNGAGLDMGGGELPCYEGPWCHEGFVAKFLANGQHIWSRSVGGTGEDELYGVAVTSSGVSFAVGRFKSEVIQIDGHQIAHSGGSYLGATMPDALAMSFSPTGEVNWAKGFGGNLGASATAVAVSGDGMVMAGPFLSNQINFGGDDLFNANPADYPKGDVFVVRLASDGTHLASWSFGGMSSDGVRGIAVGSQGEIVVAGDTASEEIQLGEDILSNKGKNDALVAKFDGTGNHIWSHLYGSPGSDVPCSVAIDDDGNVFIVGGFYGPSIDFGGGPVISPNPDNLTAFLVKLDSEGNHVFSKAMGGAMEDIAYDIAIHTSSGIVISGATGTSNVDFGGGSLAPLFAGKNEAFILRLDDNGDYLWSRLYASTGHDMAYSVAVDSNGDIVFTGEFRGAEIDFGGGPLFNTGMSQAFLAKIAEN